MYGDQQYLMDYDYHYMLLARCEILIHEIFFKKVCIYSINLYLTCTFLFFFGLILEMDLGSFEDSLTVQATGVSQEWYLEFPAVDTHALERKCRHL